MNLYQTPTPFALNEEVVIRAIVIPNRGVTYDWSIPMDSAGKIIGDNRGPSITYITPARSGTYEIQVTIGKGTDIITTAITDIVVLEQTPIPTLAVNITSTLQARATTEEAMKAATAIIEAATAVAKTAELETTRVAQTATAEETVIATTATAEAEATRVAQTTAMAKAVVAATSQANKNATTIAAMTATAEFKAKGTSIASTSTATANENATATSKAIANVTATAEAEKIATQTAIALIPTNTAIPAYTLGLIIRQDKGPPPQALIPSTPDAELKLKPECRIYGEAFAFIDNTIYHKLDRVAHEDQKREIANRLRQQTGDLNFDDAALLENNFKFEFSNSLDGDNNTWFGPNGDFVINNGVSFNNLVYTITLTLVASDTDRNLIEPIAFSFEVENTPTPCGGSDGSSGEPPGPVKTATRPPI